MTKLQAISVRLSVMLAMMAGPAYLGLKDRVVALDAQPEFMISFGYGSPPFGAYATSLLNWGDEISLVSADASWANVARGTEVWVLVAVAHDKTKAISVSLEHPDTPPGTFAIRGRVEFVLFGPDGDVSEHRLIRVDYGFSENIFAGRALRALRESSGSQGKIVFRVSPSGQPVPVAIRINGVEVWREQELF